MSSLPSTGGLGEFLDDHEEKHAIATGLGLGVATVASGEVQQLSVAATIGVQALREKRPKPAKEQDLTNDIKREPHYFLFGIAVGCVVGLVVNPSAAAGLMGVLP
ncbi:hypothetical protein [Haloarcula salina]|uniref:Uncharacterized protein n=1 Tax=Haloarcula salina TaxID=1429914 RepID=A0AA41G461_9EURY|nr:hypothetical protein [Haloarcula salina]MBV0903936.1 hypothetical protein [Haloarcula salina]